MDIFVIALCAVIAGASSWPAIETSGRKRLAWLRRFPELPDGIPSHDTFGRVFDRLAPHAFESCFRHRAATPATELGWGHIAIDGQAPRGSHGRGKGPGPPHVVSAWADRARLTPGPVAVDAKSDEITAIPQSLEVLELRGALVTIDAMGRQEEIAQRTVTGGGDYVLAVKDNRPNLLEDIQQVLEKAFDTNYAGIEHDTYVTEERGHGRRER